MKDTGKHNGNGNHNGNGTFRNGNGRHGHDQDLVQDLSQAMVGQEVDGAKLSLFEEGLDARALDILRARAKALARSTDERASETRQLVVFSLANERYGIDTAYVHEVQAVVNMSAVPCTPSFVVGVINIRGAIYSVIDIREFFGLAKREITSDSRVILVQAADLDVGILADDVEGALNIPLKSIQTSLASQVSGKDEYIEGVTRDMLIVLNIETLLSDERIIVNQEIS